FRRPATQGTAHAALAKRPELCLTSIHERHAHFFSRCPAAPRCGLRASVASPLPVGPTAAIDRSPDLAPRCSSSACFATPSHSRVRDPGAHALTGNDMIKNPADKYIPFAPFARDFAERTWPSRRIATPPIWMSTDLRDGNQALIEPMSVERKLRFFEQLIKNGFKEIEAGFPSACQTDCDFVRKLVDENRIPDDVTIIALTQAREDLIQRTVEACAGARHAIIHMYNACAPAFRKIVFRMSRDEVRAIAVEGTRMVKAEVAKHPETHSR